MALTDDLQGLSLVSPRQGTVFCGIAAGGVLTGGLEHVSSSGGHPIYLVALSGGGEPPEPGVLERTYPPLPAERTYPPLPAERTFPL